jgi:hypothetical protein
MAAGRREQTEGEREQRGPHLHRASLMGEQVVAS